MNQDLSGQSSDCPYPGQVLLAYRQLHDLPIEAKDFRMAQQMSLFPLTPQKFESYLAKRDVVNMHGGAKAILARYPVTIMCLPEAPGFRKQYSLISNLLLAGSDSR